MLWLITLFLVWMICCVFYLSVFAAAKRADEMAATLFESDGMNTKIMAS